MAGPRQTGRSRRWCRTARRTGRRSEPTRQGCGYTPKGARTGSKAPCRQADCTSGATSRLPRSRLTVNFHGPPHECLERSNELRRLSRLSELPVPPPAVPPATEDAPVIDVGSHVHVGASGQVAAGQLTPGPRHGATGVSRGRVRDGSGAAGCWPVGTSTRPHCCPTARMAFRARSSLWTVCCGASGPCLRLGRPHRQRPVGGRRTLPRELRARRVRLPLPPRPRRLNLNRVYFSGPVSSASCCVRASVQCY